MRAVYGFVMLALLPVLAACGSDAADDHEPGDKPAWPPLVAPHQPPVPFGNPAPNLPPTGSIEINQEAHAGFVTTLTFAATDPDSYGLLGEIDFGDGSPRHAVSFTGNTVSLTHTYASPGDYRVEMVVRDDQDAESATVATQAVIGRKVLFVQGYGSESKCPSGGGFASKVDDWLPALLDGPGVNTTTSADVLYASYSGRWCDGGDGSNGVFADYTGGDTCNGIDDPGGAADRLRAQIDAVAPAKVTIVGHSMGGLAAAYLVGSDPEWARERILSVVTFDSPLGGVPQLNLAALRIGGECGFNSKSTDDLSDANGDILRVASSAARHVAFYNLDATDREGVLFFDVRQAVPGDRTHLEGETLHWTFGTNHNDLWSDAPLDEVHGPAVQMVITCAVELVPGTRCERPAPGAG